MKYNFNQLSKRSERQIRFIVSSQRWRVYRHINFEEVEKNIINTYETEPNEINQSDH